MGRWIFFVPTLLVASYGFIVMAMLTRVRDPELADHFAETIYFMGFLYTLVSLGVLFFRFSTGLHNLADDSQIQQVFYYIGISVTTSIAGVLLRNMVRAGYLVRHPENADSLEKSYNLLKETADSFSSSYADTFEAIKVYLEERKENTALFNVREREYLDVLDMFTGITGKFCTGLSEIENSLKETTGALGRELSIQRESITSLAAATGQLSETTAGVRSDM